MKINGWKDQSIGHVYDVEEFRYLEDFDAEFIGFLLYFLSNNLHPLSNKVLSRAELPEQDTGEMLQ